jgi:hypothetical protein
MQRDNPCRHKAKDYFDIDLHQVRTINIVTIDAALTPIRLNGSVRRSSPIRSPRCLPEPLPVDFDWIIWVGFRPGVRDNPGSTGRRGVEDLLGCSGAREKAVYTSKRYCLKGKELTPGRCRKDCRRSAGQRHHPAVESF